MTPFITLEQLMKMCMQEIANGNAQKKILISNDDEGNGYHALYYGFAPLENYFADLVDFQLYLGDEIDNYLILG